MIQLTDFAVKTQFQEAACVSIVNQLAGHDCCENTFSLIRGWEMAFTFITGLLKPGKGSSLSVSVRICVISKCFFFMEEVLKCIQYSNIYRITKLILKNISGLTESTDLCVKTKNAMFGETVSLSKARRINCSASNPYSSFSPRCPQKWLFDLRKIHFIKSF